MRLYLCVDFESTNQTGCWWAYGCMLVSYPDGDVWQSLESYCERQASDFDDDTSQFWAKHPESYQRLRHLAQGRDQDTEEKKLCAFIQNVTDTHPGIVMVSDNPQFDLRMLDNMLLKHGYPVCGKRKDRYSRAISTLSFCHGVKSVVGNHSYNKLKLTLKSGRRPVDLHKGTLHCPLFDCAAIVANYFDAMDIARLYSAKSKTKALKTRAMNLETEDTFNTVKPRF
jgi:hypothetical protein